MNQETGRTNSFRETGNPANGKASHDNNFNIIRIIGSVLVFAGHMQMIRCGSPILIGIHGMQEMGVWILFLISGYLITKSWMSDPHPLRFAIKRFFRLWPPFAVMVLIMVFVTGPMLSDLGVKEYFHSWFHLYLMNLWFYPVYAQPGVFVNMIESYVTNGSLWTMPVEVVAYVITPILACLYGLGRGRKHSLSVSSASERVQKSNRSFYIALLVTVAAVMFDLYIRVTSAGVNLIVWGTRLTTAYHLLVMYLIGMFFTFEQARKYLNLQVACVGMWFLFIFEPSGVFPQYLLLYLVFPYFIFSFAFAPNATFRNIGRKLEPSYGIYLYGFFFQQLVVYIQNLHGVTLSYTKSLLLSAIPTLAAAVLSYYLIEKPSQRLCKRVLARLKPKTDE